MLDPNLGLQREPPFINTTLPQFKYNSSSDTPTKTSWQYQSIVIEKIQSYIIFIYAVSILLASLHTPLWTCSSSHLCIEETSPGFVAPSSFSHWPRFPKSKVISCLGDACYLIMIVTILILGYKKARLPNSLLMSQTPPLSGLYPELGVTVSPQTYWVF